MSVIHAKFEGGIFKPVGPVELPDPCDVEFEPRVVTPDADSTAVDEIFAIMSERYDSGEHDVAARHDEHQP